MPMSYRAEVALGFTACRIEQMPANESIILTRAGRRLFSSAAHRAEEAYIATASKIAFRRYACSPSRRQPGLLPIFSAGWPQ